MKIFKKALSVFLSSALALNMTAPASFNVFGTSIPEYSDMMSEIFNKAENYLVSRINDDGSIVDSTDIFDAADAFSSLSTFDEISDEKSSALSQRLYNYELSNIEERIYIAGALKDSSLLEPVFDLQKENGGFGKDEQSSSSIKDTLAFLKAVNDCSYINEYGERAAEYLISHITKDGTYAYDLTHEPDNTLTSMIVGELSVFAGHGVYYELRKAIDEANYLSAEHIRNNITESYDDSHIEAALYDQIAMAEYDEQINAAKILEDLYKSQKSDGSFAESIHTTSMALKLLDIIDSGDYAIVAGVKASFDKNTISANELNIINAGIDIECISSCSKELTLKATATNGDKTIFEESSKIILKELSSEEWEAYETAPEENDSLFIFHTNAVFKLNECVDNGIKAYVEVYDRDLLLARSDSFDIKLSDRELTKKSQIDKFYITLDNYSAIKGVPCDVSAKGNFLYTTNQDISAEMQATLEKDGKQIFAKTVPVSLSAECNTVTVDIFDHSFEGTESGEYTFRAECIYNGESILSDSKSFFYTDSGLDPEKDTHFNALWLDPELNCEFAYAGQKNDISVKTNISYESDDIFEGQLYVKAENASDKTIIAENTVDISLEPVNSETLPENGKMPKYKSDEIISFTAETTGNTVITAVLKDSEGNKIISSSKTLCVLTKAFQDLILYSQTDKSGSAVDLRWNDISTEKERYSYQLTRRKKGEIWEYRSVWNEADNIRVLNVYPAEPYLENWLNSPLEGTETSAGMGIFDIDSVYIADYNQDPEAVLFDSRRNYKYDVIFFGSADCNSGFDLSDEAYTETQKFVDEGKGVLFGHDTLCMNFDYRNFCKFAEQLGIIVISEGSVYSTNSVSILKYGTLTNYPWTIRGTLTVPDCHSFGQYVGGTLAATEWMTLNTVQLIHEGTHSHSNFYLVSNNNLAMIQTGHSNGSATDDERKVLANTLFYLYQSTRQTTAKDKTFYDIDAPDTPSADIETDGKGTFEITAFSKDNSTTYEYSIIATPSFNEDKIPASNITEHEASSGLAGFVARFSDSDKPDPDLVTYDENGEKVQDIIASDENGNAVFSMQRDEKKDGRYIHVFAVDKANNVSRELIIDTKNAGLKGDVNDDGVFNILDAAELKRWILAVPDAKLTNSRNADLDKNGFINIIDYSVMLRMLLEKNS